MQCNLNAREKVQRLVSGLVIGAAGVVLLLLLLLEVVGGWWAWTVCAMLIVAGGFGVFEYSAAWCIVKAALGRGPGSETDGT
jgi:hypothetical protein